MLAAALEQWCERGDFTVEGLQVHEEERMYKPILVIHHGDFIYLTCDISFLNQVLELGSGAGYLATALCLLGTC